MISRTTIIVRPGESASRYRADVRRATGSPGHDANKQLTIDELCQLLSAHQGENPRAAIWWRDANNRDVETPSEIEQMMRDRGMPLVNEVACASCKQPGIVLGTPCPACGAG